MANHSVEWVIPPLPVHPRPKPDEDVASLLMRTAEGMGYDTPYWILRPEAPLPLIDPSTRILWLRKKADYRLLEQLLHLDRSQLYHLTLHRFAARLQVPVAAEAASPDEIQYLLLSQAARTRFFLPGQTTQVCPECLAEDDPYGRLAWHCQFVTVCLTHRRFLIQQCPVCSAPIPAFRLTLTACPVCKKGDYRQARTNPKIEDSSLLSGQIWLLHQLGMDTSLSTLEAHDPLPAQLRPLLPWQYCDLLARFRFLLAPLLPAPPLLQGSPAWQGRLPQLKSSVHKLSPYESATLIATFHTLFVSWPTRFVAVLEALQHVNHSPEAAPGITQDFGAFYGHLVDRPEDPALAFVSEAFAEYLGKQYTRGRVHRHLRLFRRVGVERLQERPYLSAVQASRLLSISLNTVRSLLQQSLLREAPLAKRIDSRDTHVLIERASVERLQQAWEPLLPQEHVATSLLGIPSDTMAGLARRGLLSPIRGPEVDHYPVALYWPEHIERFIAALLERALPAPVPAPEGIPLAHVYRFSNSWTSLAEVVLAVLKGRLIPIDTQANMPALKRLIVLK